jgi:hypothetical protein
MTDFGLFTLFLFIHVLSAIVAFGPAFALPLIGALGAKEPAHANFGIRVSERISSRITVPVGLTMPISGVLMIYFVHLDLTARSSWWLGIAIVLYVIALTIAIFVQLPTVRQLIEVTSKAPPPPAPGSPPPSGPPPAVKALVSKVQRNGMILTVLIVLIVLLMVSKPQF